jgi:glyoxylase-like metal-dependent hydrolase (beta-lactamase superfamily II)
MSATIISIPMEHVLPAGVLGPNPMAVNVRAHLVPHETGLTLVDTGLDPSGQALDQALAEAGASWADVSEVVITHAHPDHIGALGHVRTSAPHVRIFANPAEGLGDTQPLSDGETIGSLRAFATPGHTAGHQSLVDESSGAVLIGDCLGVMDGQLGRAPEQFTADAEQAERSLHGLRSLRGARMLFAHGPEIDRPWDELDALLGD